MKRLLTAMAVALVGCSGGGADETAPASTTAAEAVTTTEAAWLDQFDGATPAGEIDGHPVAVDEAERTLYVEDCDVAERLTTEGERYGPSPRDANGDFTPGYASICRQ